MVTHAPGTATPASFTPTYDGNGNISEYLAANGATVAHLEYDPFGNLLSSTWGEAPFAHRFSTKPQDAVTGLYYYGYRSYDPVTGRWSSRDPIGERGGVNLSAFVSNHPIGSIDLFGKALLTPGSVSRLTSKEGLQYSCYCGWLDGTHFNFGKEIGTSAKHQLNSYLKGWTGNYTIGFGPNSAGGLGVTNLIVTYTGAFPPNPDESMLNSIAIEKAIGFFREYEDGQIPNDWIARLLFGAQSSYSVDDLPSYYLGILMGLRLITFEDLQKICGVVSEDDSKTMFKADNRPMTNYGHRPALWSDRGVCRRLDVETFFRRCLPMVFSLETSSSRYSSSVTIHRIGGTPGSRRGLRLLQRGAYGRQQFHFRVRGE